MLYSKPRNNRQIKENEAVIGIDVAKFEHVAAARCWDGMRLKPIKFKNNMEGIEKLLEYREMTKMLLNADNVKMALEPTGHYWLPLAEQLMKRGITVEMIQPMHSHRAKEIEDNTPNKNDEKDANIIADLLAQGKGLQLVMPKGVFAELRYLTHYRQELVTDITRKTNRLHGISDILFPELMTIFKGHMGDGVKNLLKKVPTPERVLDLGKKGVARLLSKYGGEQYKAEKTELILNAAQRSIGAHNGQEALVIELEEMLKQLKASEECLEKIEQQIKERLKEVPYINNLRSISYLGEITIATILGETGDLRNYRHSREILKLAGLNLYGISSGTFKGKKRITKRGRPFLRQMLYLAALRMLKRKQSFYVFYQRLRSTGLHKVAAIVACACKLLRVIFTVVKNNDLFDERKVGVQTSYVTI